MLSQFAYSLKKIKKNISASIINQLILIIGTVSAFVIFSFADFHKSFDNFHSSKDNVYRIYKHKNSEGVGQNIALTEGPVKSAVSQNVPGVEGVTHFMSAPFDFVFEANDKVFIESKGLLVDDGFHNVFDFTMVEGDKQKMFLSPNSIAISQSLALKFFGKTKNILNELLTLKVAGQEVPLKVTGIFNKMPLNSHIQADFLITGVSIFLWNDNNPYSVFYSYVKMQEEVDTKRLGRQISSILNSQQAENDGGDQYFAESIRDIHLSSSKNFELSPGFESKYILIFTSIGGLVLLVSLLNFFNMYASNFMNRIREVSTRKILGVSLKEIKAMLFSEIILVVLIAISLSAFLSYFILSTRLKPLLGFEIEIEHSVYFLLLFMITVFVGWLIVNFSVSKIYSLNAVDALKGRFKVKREKLLGLKNIFIFTQFTISLSLGIFSTIVLNQLDVLQNQDLGFNIHNVISLKRPDTVSPSQWKNFRQQLETQPFVRSTGQAVFPSIGDYNSLSIENVTTHEKHRVFWLGIDPSYIVTMGIEVLQGRNFDKNMAMDKNKIILNEKAYELFGGKNSIDHKFKFSRVKNTNAEILGVVKDFNSYSVKENVPPIIMSLGTPMAMRHLVVKVNGSVQFSEVIKNISALWENVGITGPFDYSILDEEFNSKMIGDENTLSDIAILFCSLSILICVLGVISLLSYYLRQKRKEISIRKVLGAGFISNLLYITIPYVRLISISAIISTFLAYYYANKWLANFIYRTDIHLYHFLLPCITLVLIVSVVILIFSNGTLRSNPIESLREE